MDTVQIINILKCNNYTRKIFKGVFPLNKVPKIIKRPAIIVVNTDPSTKPGTHWIAIYCPSVGCIEFFDSYGRRPRQKEFVKFLSRNSNCYIANGHQLQSYFSNVCGHYCCVYLWYRCIGKSMQTFIQQFDRNRFDKNDKLILNMFKHAFDQNPASKKYKQKKFQMCKALRV